MPSVAKFYNVREDDPVVVEGAWFTAIKYNALAIPGTGIVNRGSCETNSLVGICIRTGIIEVVVVADAEYEGIHAAMGFVFAFGEGWEHGIGWIADPPEVSRQGFDGVGQGLSLG
jgi:hypothetical protein